LWSRDGAELFYRRGDRLMCVDMRPNHDVGADGASFLLVAGDTPAAPADLLITIDCFSHLG